MKKITYKKVKGGYAVKHCHGKNKGKTIKKYTGKGAKSKARKMHRAIQANKKRRRK